MIPTPPESPIKSSPSPRKAYRTSNLVNSFDRNLFTSALFRLKQFEGLDSDEDTDKDHDSVNQIPLYTKSTVLNRQKVPMRKPRVLKGITPNLYRQQCAEHRISLKEERTQKAIMLALGSMKDENKMNAILLQAERQMQASGVTQAILAFAIIKSNRWIARGLKKAIARYVLDFYSCCTIFYIASIKTYV